MAHLARPFMIQTDKGMRMGDVQLDKKKSFPFRTSFLSRNQCVIEIEDVGSRQEFCARPNWSP